MTYDPNNPNRVDPNRRVGGDSEGMSGAMMALSRPPKRLVEPRCPHGGVPHLSAWRFRVVVRSSRR